ncbi:Ig lambda chain V-I region BL2 [Heterocephalus glaber]|nr:Ig lambda chain V-I region BL2 [Heterocephalus glaber]
MDWAPLLLTFLSLYTGSMAQAVLTQPPSLSKVSGETAILTCTGNSNNVGYEGAGWVQLQQQGQSPKTLVNRNNNRLSGIPERFSGTRSGNSASLTITGIQPEDEADYYCAAWDKSQSASTTCQVNGEVRQKPRSSHDTQIHEK